MTTGNESIPPDETKDSGSSEIMPVLFVGHGSPMNAIEDNPFSHAWEEMGRTLPCPRAIVVISAHWETAGTCVTAMERPSTLYDFHGFPQELYEISYPAPGDPGLARSIKKAVSDPVINLDFGWGLDHGAWSVLRRMFPAEDIPVVQLSLDFDRPPEFHYGLGKQLAFLRKQGIMIIGSGNIVHNLRAIVWEDTAFDWARKFDERVKCLILAGEHQPLIDYTALGEDALLAIPTNEHYLPLLYVLALQDPADRISFFCESVTLGSVSMRSFILDSATR